jgi:hypothetical protein
VWGDDDSDHMRLDTREEDNMSHHSDDGMLIAGRVPVLEVPVLHSRATNESWNENHFHFLENAHTIVPEVGTNQPASN